MRILIVDDHPYNRELLRYILEDEGFVCVEAENGQAALETFLADIAIDLILMDVNMPVMDGLVATQKIVQCQSERHITIIFVTALDNPEVLAKCLEIGGDDFVPKPINETVLVSKVHAHFRNQDNYNKLLSAHQELRVYHQATERDHAIVDYVFSNGIDRASTYCDNIQTYTSPMSMFNGDLALTAPSACGGQYGFVGDFTGHGLSAAIGSLPVTSIFFSQVSRQASVSQIAAELNSQLHTLLPMGMFCCASIFHLSRCGRELSLWAGGMSDILVVELDYSLRRISGDHMPLGVLSALEFDERIQLHSLAQGSYFYIYTDGIDEAKNTQQEEFGQERIMQWLQAAPGSRVSNLVNAVHEFQGQERQDDITLVEVHCAALVHRSKADKSVVDIAAEAQSTDCFPWALNMTLASKDLKRTDVIQQTLSFLGTIQGLKFHQSKLFTILSELFNNALEHGVLALDSCLKNSPDGFVEYYRLRQERLESLTDGSVHINMQYLRGEPNRLRLEITNSGVGFDFAAKLRAIEQSDDVHGRGLHLLNALCSELTYSNLGRTATACYDFTGQ